MSDTPAVELVETHDLEALRAEVDQLRADIAAEQQQRATALSQAENGIRAQRLVREREDLKAQLAALRGTAVPTAEAVVEPEQPVEIAPPPLDPVTLRALPVDPDRPDPNVVADANAPAPADQPQATTDTATKRR